MIQVKKLDGTLQRYDPAKLKRSLANAGADREIIDEIMPKLDKILYDGIETRALFKFVFNELKKHQPSLASRYDLKNSILRLGVAGYAFEKFVAALLLKMGFSIKLNQIVKGRYVPHEIDVIAAKGRERVMVECKHHVKPWLGCDIQTALYVFARFLDVQQYFTMPMLVTNTKFSEQVIRYSRGVGLRLMGWKFPQDDSLEYHIERFRLYPITMLSSLEHRHVDILLHNSVLLIRELALKDSNFISKMLGVSLSKADKILADAANLVRNGS